MNNQQSNNKINNDRFYNERNNYFTGKYMTARDFRAEQNYFVSHHRWHHWNLHGWGIVWGLKVDFKDPENKQCLYIAPGMAIDCHGRELLYTNAQGTSLDKLESADKKRDLFKAEDVGTKEVLIGLQYDEIPRHEVPLLLEDECQPNKNAYNRIEETVRVCWKYLETYGDKEIIDPCWTFPKPYEPSLLPHVIKEESEPGECGCHHIVKLQPPCECGPCGFVPLARLRKDPNGEWKLDDLGCRYVPSPFYGEALTHIVGINWNHAGETNISEITRDNALPDDNAAKSLYASICHYTNGLVILKFDRALAKPLHCDGDLAEESNFFSQLIELEYIKADKKGDTELYDLDGDDFHPIAPRLVVLSTCRQMLYCYFPANRLNRDLPVLLRLKLNCDMLVDARGRSVDGDHIGGHIRNLKSSDQNNTIIARSGNGTEGGRFYSWTKIINIP